MKKILLSILMIAAVISTSTAQRLKTPSGSPNQVIKQEFATSSITINYSRPSTKGRTIFGDLVPYGAVWRTGANMATSITFEEEVSLNGNKVAPGSYALFTIPGEDEWTIILNKNTKSWGINDYKETDDVLRFAVKSNVLPEPVETFTIQLNNLTSNAASLDILWEKTKVSMHVTADIDAKIMAQIEEAMKTENKPYYDAAMYYFEYNKDLGKALEWIDEAIKLMPDQYWMYHAKAKMLMKNKSYEDLIPVAEKSKELAVKAGNKDYVRFNEQLIEEAKRKI